MIKINEIKSDVLKDEEDNSIYAENIYIFQFEDEEEEEDFGLLSHNEQLSELGFKEDRTPAKGPATVHRYFIDPGDVFVVVRENIISWN